MPVSCHFKGCKGLLRTVKRRYIKYHAFAFHKCIPCNNRCVQNFIQIGRDLAVRGPKNLLWSKNRERPSLCLAVNKVSYCLNNYLINVFRQFDEIKILKKMNKANNFIAVCIPRLPERTYTESNHVTICISFLLFSFKFNNKLPLFLSCFIFTTHSASKLKSAAFNYKGHETNSE